MPTFRDNCVKGKGNSGHNYNNIDGWRLVGKDGKLLCLKRDEYGHKVADCLERKNDECNSSTNRYNGTSNGNSGAV